MNSNELNNYINSLNEYGNNELKVKLENFYLFNKPVISFFKGIDSQFHSLMSANSIDENTINSIVSNKEILDALTNAKRELFSFDEIILSESVKNKLLKNYDYIVNTMVLNEALTMIQKFYTLLSENELALKSEQEELENLRKKKIEDDRKKKEEEKRKEELRLAEVELKKQEEIRKQKELEEKRRQEEIRLKQEKERIEREKIEALKRKDLEEKRKEELRLTEIELKKQEENRIQKGIEEKRRQEELRLKQTNERIIFLDNYLKKQFIEDLNLLLKTKINISFKARLQVGDKYPWSGTYQDGEICHREVVYREVVFHSSNNVFQSTFSVKSTMRFYYISVKKSFFGDTKQIISNYRDEDLSFTLDPISIFYILTLGDRCTYVKYLSYKDVTELFNKMGLHEFYGKTTFCVPLWDELIDYFHLEGKGKSWQYIRRI